MNSQALAEIYRHVHLPWSFRHMISGDGSGWVKRRRSTPKLKLNKNEKGSTRSSPQQHLKLEIPVSPSHFQLH